MSSTVCLRELVIKYVCFVKVMGNSWSIMKIVACCSIFSYTGDSQLQHCALTQFVQRDWQAAQILLHFFKISLSLVSSGTLQTSSSSQRK